MAVSPKKTYNPSGYGQKSVSKTVTKPTSRKTVGKTVKKPPAGKTLSKPPTPKTAGKSLKAPGKTILPKTKYKKQRRFSLIDSDSSLSEVDSEDDGDLESLRSYNTQGQFQAIDSHSEDDDNAIEDDDADSDSENEELWRNHADQVVNTSSEEEEDDDDDEDDEEDEDSASSSSDDENVDFVKLTAERKARLQQFRSGSPFTNSTSPKKKPVQTSNLKKENELDDDNEEDDAPLLIKSPVKNQKKEEDVDFTFDFNKNDNEIKFGTNDNEEDVGEELVEMIPDFDIDDMIIPRRQSIAPLTGFVNIEDSDDSDNEIDKDQLLKTLEQESDGVETQGFSTGEDDYNLLKEEADNILQEYGNGEDHFQFSSQNTHRNSAVDEVLQKHKDEINPEEILQYISEDDYDEYDDDDDVVYDQDQFQVPFFDDAMFLKEKYTGNNRLDNTPNDEKEHDSDDDSYLWDYFFSSGDERITLGDNDGDDNVEEEIISEHYSDDEETDEDTSLPPPSSRSTVASSTTKAQELLSSSSVTARPPALGTWSTDSKPFGIIDGLSTRSLIPVTNSRKNSDFTPHSSTILSETNTPHSSPDSPSDANSNAIEEMNIDDLLNISEFEDDSDDPQHHFNQQEWDEVTGGNRKVPLSAFRNKGVVNPEQNHLNAARRYSTASSNNGAVNSSNSLVQKHNGKKSGSKNHLNEITMMSPVRVKHKPKKQSGKRPSISKSRNRKKSMVEAASEGMVLTKSGLFHEDTLLNVEELLSGLGSEAELSILFQ